MSKAEFKRGDIIECIRDDAPIPEHTLCVVNGVRDGDYFITGITQALPKGGMCLCYGCVELRFRKVAEVETDAS